MLLLVVYMGLAIAGNVGVYLICYTIEQMYPAASLPVFLFLFFAVMGLAWIVAVKLTAPKSEAAAT